MNIDEIGLNILRFFELGFLEELIFNEVELLCSCGGEKCLYCELKSVLEVKVI